MHHRIIQFTDNRLFCLNLFHINGLHRSKGDISGQIDPLLSSFDEPVPLTAIPTNTLLNRLEEEESALIEEYDTDIDTDADSHHRRQQEDEDAKIPLLTSPEVNAFFISPQIE